MIGSDGKLIGIVTPDEGVKRAREENLDLVEISPTAKPPVCRIIDFGKYIYSLEKQEKEAKKKQHVISIKEVKMTSKIEEHDYQTKLRSAISFLERGDKVKLSLMFRGREIMHAELGQRIVNRFTQDISDVGEIEKNQGLEGKVISIMFAARKQPKKSGSEKANAGGKAVK